MAVFDKLTYLLHMWQMVVVRCLQYR